MGDTKWAIQNGRYKMGDSKWAIRNGRYEMSDTKWAIRNGYNLQLVIYFSKNESSVHTTVRGGDVRVHGRVFWWEPGRKLSSFGARIWRGMHNSEYRYAQISLSEMACTNEF